VKSDLSSSPLNLCEGPSRMSVRGCAILRSLLEPVSRCFGFRKSACVNSKTHQSAFIILIITLFAILATFPCLLYGLPEGHDRIWHVGYQHFFNAQLRSGDLYPRWITGLNEGLGAPVFFLQYPLPYFAAAGLGRVLPVSWGDSTETRTLGIVVVASAILAGIFTFLWCSTFADRRAALCASLAYLTLPYPFAIDLYWRTAVGEYVALAWLPLGLYFIERMQLRPRSATAGLGVAFSLVVVSHLFTAIIYAPVLFLYAACRSSGDRWMAVLRAATGIALGAGLSGFYLLPMAAHQKYFHVERLIQIQGANFSYRSNLFPFTADLYPNASHKWIMLGWIARVLTIALIALILVRLVKPAGRSRKKLILGLLSIACVAAPLLANHLGSLGSVSGAPVLKPILVEYRAQVFLSGLLTLQAGLVAYWFCREPAKAMRSNVLLLVLLASFFMTTSWSLPVWIALRFLWSLQFPWRFDVLMTIATVGLVSAVVDEVLAMPKRSAAISLACGMAFYALIAGQPARFWNVFKQFERSAPAVFQPMIDVAAPTYAEISSVAELETAGHHEQRAIDAQVIQGTGTGTIQAINARLLQLNVRCNTACIIDVSQLYYPAWRARQLPSQVEVPLHHSCPGGLMELDLPAGKDQIEIALPVGMTERLGGWVSAVCLLIAAWLFVSRGREHATPTIAPIFVPRHADNLFVA
jgi:hypothetical protein